jgi:galactokinase/mevalonate kinase-like predicted kinase
LRSLNQRSVPSTIVSLIENAETGYQNIQKLFSFLLKHSVEANIDHSDILDDLIDELAETMNRLVSFHFIVVLSFCFCSYWTLKKQMAKGSNPPHISKVLDRLSSMSKGIELAGAGGGGFVVVILNRDCSKQGLQMLIDELNAGQSEDPLLTVREVAVDNEGIVNEFLFEEIRESRNVEQYLDVN